MGSASLLDGAGAGLGGLDIPSMSPSEGTEPTAPQSPIPLGF